MLFFKLNQLKTSGIKISVWTLTGILFASFKKQAVYYLLKSPKQGMNTNIVLKTVTNSQYYQNIDK